MLLNHYIWSFLIQTTTINNYGQELQNNHYNEDKMLVAVVLLLCVFSCLPVVLKDKVAT